MKQWQSLFSKLRILWNIIHEKDSLTLWPICLFNNLRQIFIQLQIRVIDNMFLCCLERIMRFHILKQIRIYFLQQCQSLTLKTILKTLLQAMDYKSIKQRAFQIFQFITFFFFNNIFHHQIQRQFLIKDLKFIILQTTRNFKMNILETQLGVKSHNPQQDAVDAILGVECPETKFCLWQDDQYEQMEVDYLNQVFPEKLNKKTMSPGTQFIFHFLSSSLYYWIELRQNQKPDPEKLSLKDITVISQVLKQTNVQNDIAFNRWGLFFNKRQQFQNHVSQQKKFEVPKGGKIIHEYTRNDQNFEIVRYLGDNPQLALYKKRFEVIFLFYIDGVSYVHQQTDQWVYFIIYRKDSNGRKHFVGVLSKYDFRISSIKQRHRISQVLVLPCYQSQGHGKTLMDLVYKQSLEMKQCFEITTQAPSFEFQCLRDFKQVQLILSRNLFDLSVIKQIKSKEDLEFIKQKLLDKKIIRGIKECVKMPGHQIERIANILIYNRLLESKNDEGQAIFQQDLRQRIIFNRSVFKTRRKLPHITVRGKSIQLKDFIIQKQKQDFLRDQSSIQEILTETLKGFRRISNKIQKSKMLQKKNNEQ